MEFGISGIYKISNKSNGKFYIGSTTCFRTRFTSHKSMLRRNAHKNLYLQNSWNKYGSKSFKFEIIELVDKHDKLIEREQFWIDKTKCYDNSIGYNISKTARTNLGAELSDETKRKISIANKGRKHTLQSRLNMAKSKIGVKQSKEQVESRMKSIILNGSRKGENHHFYGKSHSEEMKQKISDSHKGKHIGTNNNFSKLDEEKVKRIKLLLRDGRMSQGEIAKMFNIKQQNVSSIKRGNTWSHVSVE